MEGSWHYRDVDNYELLASYYDALLQDEESFSYWLQYIEQCKGKKILELASGSGVLARILQEKGYEVIASDLSEAMRDVALKTNFKGDYRILNMIDFHLEERFDIVLCICDSVNYLMKEELKKMFQAVYEHLNIGGTFLFDMHSLDRLDEFEEEYIEEGVVEGVGYQWAILADKEEKEMHERFIFYTEDGIVQEHHTQNVFDIPFVEECLKEVGFEVKVVEDFIPHEKVLMIGEKR